MTNVTLDEFDMKYEFDITCMISNEYDSDMIIYCMSNSWTETREVKQCSGNAFHD